jgi:hypothetical protein
MRQNQSIILTLSKLTACALLIVGASVRADDKADPTGTWTWTMPGRNGGPDRTNTLTLKADSGKLTGKVAAPGRGGQTTEAAISDGVVTADGLTFNIVRERNGNSMTNKYSGKIDGNKLTGKIEFTRDGETQSRDWTATRAAATDAAK